MADDKTRKLLISACLMGIKCRYDGGHAFSPEIPVEDSTLLIPVCPEQLGGLPTPREPSEIEFGSGEDVLDGKSKVVGIKTGMDYTDNFINGAEQTLKMSQIFGCSGAIFKSNSPSCGKGRIKRAGKYTEGTGVTAALMIRNGLDVEVL